MKRRSFLAALAAIPVVGETLKAADNATWFKAPPEARPLPQSATAELARLSPDQRRFEVVYDTDWDNPFGAVIHRDAFPVMGLYGHVFMVHTIYGTHRVPDLHRAQRVLVDHVTATVWVEYKDGSKVAVPRDE